MSRSSRGDTIIEVLISIAVIGLALGAGYTLSSRSFRTGVGAVERTEALALAQGQVEFLKDAQLGGTMGTTQAYALGLAGTNPTNPSFCFDTSSGAKNAPNLNPSTYPAACTKINGRYDMQITYNTPQANVFNIVASWPAFGGSGQDQLTLYYKVP